MATSELEQVITTNGNVIIKEEISLEDTEIEQQKSEQNDYCEADVIKPEELHNVQQVLVRQWPITDTVKTDVEQCITTCNENIIVKDEVFIQDEDSVDIECNDNKEFRAGKKNVITGRHTIHKDCLLSDDGQVVLKNFSEDDMYCSVENHITGSLGCSHSDRNVQCTKRNAKNICECSLRNSDIFHSSIQQQNLNTGEKSTPPNLVTQTTPVKCTKTKNYICDVCDKIFSRHYRLVRHKLVHGGVKNFYCSVCTKSFTRSYSFLRHKLVHSGDKNYCCDVCNTTFTVSSALLQHKLIHSDVKNYRCNICDKAFSQKWTLSQHKLVHSELKRHKCKECDKTFARASTLTRHKLAHSGIRKYRCDVCGKTFSRSYTLSHHKLTHMGVYKNQCDICNKTFSMPGTLAQHKLIHEGKKVYQCDKCNKDFYYMASLKNHKLIHSECKKYQCSNCSEGFMSKNDLKKHVLIHMMVDSNDEN